MESEKHGAAALAAEDGPITLNLARHRREIVSNAAKWILAIVGLLIANLMLRVVVSVCGSVGLVRLGLVGAGGSISPRGVLAIGVMAQLAWLAVVLPWWRHVRRRGMGVSLDTPRVPVHGRCALGRAALTLGAIVLMGVGLQVVVSLLLNVILPLFPKVQGAYTEMMESSGTNEFTGLSIVSLAVLAPLEEELTFRGVAFQFALRAVAPAVSNGASQHDGSGLLLSHRRFWLANILQALAFGVMHLNITQGIYAFATGLVFGWLFGRTGRLRYGMGLHAAVNFSSYFVGELMGAFAAFGGIGVFVLPVACLAAGIWLFERTVPVNSRGALAQATDFWRQTASGR